MSLSNKFLGLIALSYSITGGKEDGAGSPLLIKTLVKFSSPPPLMIKMMQERKKEVDAVPYIKSLLEEKEGKEVDLNNLYSILGEGSTL